MSVKLDGEARRRFVLAAKESLEALGEPAAAVYSQADMNREFPDGEGGFDLYGAKDAFASVSLFLEHPPTGRFNVSKIESVSTDVLLADLQAVRAQEFKEGTSPDIFNYINRMGAELKRRG